MLELIIGLTSDCLVQGESFIKSYFFIDESSSMGELHWTRIREAALLLSEHRIGPKVKSIDESSKTIEYQRVIPLGILDSSPRPNLSVNQIIEQINQQVTRLHQLGYGHGDLHLENIGFIGNDLYLLDHDTVYRIEDGPVDWLKNWMEEDHDWDGTFEEFVENDYQTWRSDWIY